MLNRICFVFHPYSDEARIDTIPFAKNTLRALARAAQEIDLYTWEPPGERPGGLPANIRINYVRQQRWMNFWRIRGLAHSFWSRRLQSFPRYDLIIGLGQFGCFQAGILAQRQKVPWIYVSDEYPAPRWMQKGVLAWEAQYAHTASAIIVPDKTRGRLGNGISELLPVNPGVPILEVLNVPDPSTISPTDPYERFGIPPGKKIILNAGTLNEGFAVPELLTSVPTWPDDSVLLINAAHKKSAHTARQNYGHLHLPNRIFWGEGGLSEADLNGLVQTATASLGLFRPVDELMEDQGKGTGKIMRSIALSTPVIVTHQKALRFISDHQLGILVRHPMEIGPAIRRIIDEQVSFRTNCRRYADHFMQPENWEKPLLEVIVRITNGKV